MTEHPTATWQAMQDGSAFYRRQQLYSIPGKLVDFEDYIVAGCQYGGPLGLSRSIILLSGDPNQFESAYEGQHKASGFRAFNSCSCEGTNSDILSSGREPLVIQCGWSHLFFRISLLTDTKLDSGTRARSSSLVGLETKD